MTRSGSELPTLRAIGFVRCSQRVHHEAPRQSGLGRGGGGEIHVAQGFQNCLQDLAGFSHVWILFCFHLARGCRHQVVPPRDVQKRGVFATRAPQRPNPIGMSCVRLVRVVKRVLYVADHDLLDGTPVIDIKPYLAYCDSVPNASLGYVAGLPEDVADHRAWWLAKGVPPPRVYGEIARDRVSGDQLR